MHTKVFLSNDTKVKIDRLMVIASHHNRSHKRAKARQRIERSEAQFDSKSYRDGLQRAFNKAKQQIYFNPDMQYFVTLTYAGNGHDISQVMDDLKLYFKTERRNGNEDLKYIWVAEYQKRGSIHIHMITNAKLETEMNRNGYLSLKNWKHGFTSYLHIQDFDQNFKPYLYLFKYMRKSQRIGKSFLHSSRNLNNYEEQEDAFIDYEQWNTVNQERTSVTINENTFNVYRYYLQRAIIEPQTITEATNGRPKRQ